MNYSRALLTVSLIATCVSMDCAHATTVLKTSSASLTSPDSINWNQVGSDSTLISGPKTVMSALGVSETVSSAGSFEVRHEGASWGGNFSNGTPILWTDNQGPDISITFSKLVSGVGAQIQTDSGGPFTAEITAFGVGGAVLGSFTENGYSAYTNNGSAIFIGLQDTTADIAKITFSVVSSPDFAIGTVDFTSAVAAVPEPSAWAMMILGLCGVGFMAYRKREPLSQTQTN